jgi:hypothetical protein
MVEQGFFGTANGLGQALASIGAWGEVANQSNAGNPSNGGIFGTVFRQNRLLQAGLGRDGGTANNTMGGLRMQAAGIGADAQAQPQAQAQDRTRVGDVYPTQNGVLHLRYGDANMDRALANPNYDKLQIETPQGVQLRNWADQNGYYFWFQNTANGQMVDGQKHYYPPFVKQLCVNGQVFDLDAQRLKCNEDMANFYSKRNYFENLNGRQVQDPNYAVAFAGRLSGLSGSVLASEEAMLQQSARNSSNPYFKIYLADVYTAQAMQPIINQFKETGHIDIANPQTKQRIQMAIDVLNAAVSDSRNGLAQMNQGVQGNVSMPLDPYEIYMNRGLSGYYGFWGGAYDQAMYRASTLTVLQNLIQTSALPSVLARTDLLPPP